MLDWSIPFANICLNLRPDHISLTGLISYCASNRDIIFTHNYLVMESWVWVKKSTWIYIYLWPCFTSPWPVNFEMFGSFSDSIATHFKLRQRNMFTEWHVETRLADSLELPMTLTTSCLRVMLWMARWRSREEIYRFFTPARVYKARIRPRVLTFILFSSPPSSIACWFK